MPPKLSVCRKLETCTFLKCQNFEDIVVLNAGEFSFANASRSTLFECLAQ